jgi:biotin synthase
MKQHLYREHHDPNVVQVSTLLFKNRAQRTVVIAQAWRAIILEGNDLMTVSLLKHKLYAQNQEDPLEYVQQEKRKDGPEFDQVLEMVRTINKLDMEVCCTLGSQKIKARQLKLVCMPITTTPHTLKNNKEVISTRRGFEDRLQT